ncbi:hypothetical protein Bca52824_050941 [Brassica carinata]|uniref:Uncharacterized protein n=1 Tax=Brassica carinata TaxID=52824 RepID=A0A8X7UJC0_BRACI|nr:hypothetical protein Bca52824_050941 [Brassica carinata]
MSLLTIFKDLPKILSSDFSIVLMGGTILKSEMDKIKEFLIKFSYDSEAFEILFEELKGMTPMVRYASMKNLVALFDSDDARYRTVRTRGHVALKLIAEMAVRPSEVHDGLDLIKKTPSILGSIQNSREFGEMLESLEEFPLPLTTLIKKLEVFEICEAKLTLQKIKVVKSLSETMLLLKSDGEISEKIMECMKFICEGEIGLQGVLEKASGTDLVSLLPKTEEEYSSRRQADEDETQTLVVKGRLMMNKGIFDFKWTHKPASTYQSMEGDAICYVELLVHYLNLKTIHGE